jgi:multidrug efflux pump subunit AcrA (membrane-fusion protein)
MTESESRTPNWTLRTTGEHPLPGRGITARRRQSGVRRILRLWRPPPFGRWTAVICLLTALCAGTVVILSGRSAGLSLATGSETTDDAYVRADQIAISSHITGYVESVLVRDNETVSQGQVVATILNDDYRARLLAAEADLQVAQIVSRYFDSPSCLAKGADRRRRGQRQGHRGRPDAGAIGACAAEHASQRGELASAQS